VGSDPTRRTASLPLRLASTISRLSKLASTSFLEIELGMFEGRLEFWAEDASAADACAAEDFELVEPERAEVTGGSVAFAVDCGEGRHVGKEADAAGTEGPEDAEEGGLAEARCSSTEVAPGVEPSGKLQLHVRVHAPTSKAC